MPDQIIKYGASVIQHGKLNDRIYVLKLKKPDFPEIIPELDQLANEKKYSKIVVKAPGWSREKFVKHGYIEEASVPDFYNGETDVFFLSRFVDRNRAKINPERKQKLEQNIKLAQAKQNHSEVSELKKKFTLRQLNENDVEQLVAVYKQVFDSYPFPIFNPDYLISTMKQNIIYFGAFDAERLVAASSAEMDEASQNVEMTDFATLPEYRGNSLAIHLLRKMEQAMGQRKMHLLYTIARAQSPGMNITFAKSGYEFSGTLVNNTNISGRIESMNVWYKKVAVE